MLVPLQDGADIAALGEFHGVADEVGKDLAETYRVADEARGDVAADSAGNAVHFTVSPPRTLQDQIKIEARRRIGSEQVLALYPSPYNTRINRPSDLGNALKNGASLIDIAIYLAMKTAALVQYKWNQKRGKAPVWVRDIGAREQA